MVLKPFQLKRCLAFFGYKAKEDEGAKKKKEKPWTTGGRKTGGQNWGNWTEKEKEKTGRRNRRKSQRTQLRPRLQNLEHEGNTGDMKKPEKQSKTRAEPEAEPEQKQSKEPEKAWVQPTPGSRTFTIVVFV